MVAKKPNVSLETAADSSLPSTAEDPVWRSSEARSLSVLMPIYNESRTLRTIIGRLFQIPLELEVEIVCVDDRSTDGSWNILQELSAAHPQIRVFRQDRNRGKGAAIRRAIGEMKGDLAIIQDADLEYDPADIPAVIAPILAGKADAVIGSRFASTSQRKILLFKHALANKLLTFLCNWLNDVNLTDMETCYKAVRSDILKSIPLKSDRFGIEPELTTRFAQWNLRLYEVPISYHGRTYAEGKKIGLIDAIEAVWCLFKYRYLDPKFTDHDGYYILESTRRARGFNRWMFSQFKRYVGDRVFEAGTGIGNFSEQLLDRQRLVCADLEPIYIEMLRRRFGHLENIRTTRMDLTDPEAYENLREERLDTVISLNVVEHIEDDARALRLFHDVLEPGGHAIVLVPAHMWLFSKCDETLGHHQRYDSEILTERMKVAGFELLEVRQFNRLGVLGWYVNKILGRSTLSPGQMRLYEWLLPVAKAIDAIGVGPGLSLVAVGRKSD